MKNEQWEGAIFSGLIRQKWLLDKYCEQIVKFEMKVGMKRERELTKVLSSRSCFINSLYGTHKSNKTQDVAKLLIYKFIPTVQIAKYQILCYAF